MSTTLLRRLADHYGIVADYVDVGGRARQTTDETRRALLAAMGIDTSSEAALRAAYHRAASTVAGLPGAAVVERGRTRRLSIPLAAHVGAVRWELELRGERGGLRRASGSSRRAAEVLHIPLPADLPLGYHDLALSLHAGGSERRETQTLIVAPAGCPAAPDRLDKRKLFGLLVNLYTVRRDDDWGVGDVAALRALVELAAANGAAFVGVNPLAALDNRTGATSPYSPTSRLFANPLYLDVAAFPELDTLPDLRARLASEPFRRDLAALRAAADVDYEAVIALKQSCFTPLHRAFARLHRDQSTPRGRAYTAFLQRRGDCLIDFATFLALREHLGATDASARDWRAWPQALRDPASPAVREFRAAHREAVDLHCFLQFELERQLESVAGLARRRGLPLGLYQDLPLGSAPDGADSWAFQRSFLSDVSIGAPPDDYNSAGQDWGLPPLDPRRLAADRYRYWIEMLRASLRGSGALRIDHVMGLFRQYWIPRGHPPEEGAYVRYPAAELLGILALEATRADALVIGEDLGTVPAEIPPLLAKWNILSTRVLYFSRDEHGEFAAARTYPKRALVSANTHDLPPLAGYWSGRDLEIRRDLGVLPTDEDLRRAREQRESECAALLRRLRAEGLLPAQGAPDAAELRRAVHAFLCRTQAWLVGIAYDDLLGEDVAVNQPGVPLDRYPSWARRARLSLEALGDDPAVAAALAQLRAERRSLRRRAPTRR